MRTIKALTAVGLSAFLAVVIALVTGGSAMACGGFFCQNDPVDQVAERIVFTVNDDDTVSSLIEISYAGDAADFSWILPIPEPIGVDDVAVPDDGEIVFDELHRLTDMSFVNPDRSECANEINFGSETDAMANAWSMALDSVGVEVFASGEVGPFGFDVIGADDPMALTDWLRENNYQVESSMEPLINVYVEEDFSFLAMRLLDGETSESISPVEITYPGAQPMVPLRLTAVAAFPEMPIFLWIFADEQAVPENYVHFEIATEELTFSPFGANNYTRLVQQRADAVGGRGFITEFAGPSANLPFGDTYLVERAAEQPYLTRLITYIDPEEMLVDPVFGFDAEADDVSNVRNARSIRGLYDCERQQSALGQFSGSEALDAALINAQLRAGTFAGYDNLDPEVRLSRNEVPADPDPTDPDAADPDTTDPDAADPDTTETAGGIAAVSDDGLSTPLIVVLAIVGTLLVLGAVGGAFVIGRRGTSAERMR